MRIRPIVAALATAAVMVPSALHAQTPADRPITVTVRMSTAYPLGPGDDEAALEQKAREAFYKTAAGECALITEALDGVCALKQMNVTTQHRDLRVGGNPTPSPTVFGEATMSFTVTPAAPAEK